MDTVATEFPKWFEHLEEGETHSAHHQAKRRQVCDPYVVVAADADVADVVPADVAEVPADAAPAVEAAAATDAATEPAADVAPALDAAPAPAAAADASASAFQWYVVIGRNGATLRRGVNLDTELLGELPRGTKVAVVDAPRSHVCRAELPLMNRNDAAAAVRIVRGDESRDGSHADSPRRRESRRRVR